MGLSNNIGLKTGETLRIQTLPSGYLSSTYHLDRDEEVSSNSMKMEDVPVDDSGQRGIVTLRGFACQRIAGDQRECGQMSLKISYNDKKTYSEGINVYTLDTIRIYHDSLMIRLITSNDISSLVQTDPPMKN